MINNKEYLDFVCIGAPRAGTTWVYHALSEHPDIWIPSVKELNFFDAPYLNRKEFKYERGLDYYRKQFQDAPLGALLGELTPTYYVDEKVARRIYDEFPDVKIIVMLRNPVDVMYSTYLKTKEYGVTDKTFEEALKNNRDLYKLGYYYKNLSPYFKLFAKENIYIRVFEEFFVDQVKECERLYEFLGVDKSFRPSVLDRKINERRVVRSEIVVRLRHYLRSFINTKPMLPIKRVLTANGVLDMLNEKIVELNLKNGDIPPVKKETREMLLEHFNDDTKKLSDLLSKNLDIWK